MHYALEDVIEFSKNIEKQCGQTGVPPKMSPGNWQKSQQLIMSCYNTLNETPTSKNLELYAQAINITSQFFYYHKKITPFHLNFFKDHLQKLYKTAAEILPKVAIELPAPVNHTVLGLNFFHTSKKNPNLARTAAATIFLNSGPFVNLKKYRDETLINDRRNHRFFNLDLTVKNKNEILNQFIHALEAQTSMDGIHKIIKSFYESKGGSDNVKSIYDYLNTGQNITNLLFGLKTSTIKLINNLNAYAINTLEVNDLEKTLDLPLNA